jgi:hypothetical protein
MGNKCMRPSLALDDSSHGIESPAFFALRYPEKHRNVRELEAAVEVLNAVAHGNQSAKGEIVWEDEACVSHRSVVNCLDNQIMHLRLTCGVDSGKRRVGRKQVSVCDTIEVMERWGEAGALLFTSEQLPTSPSYEEDPSKAAPTFTTASLCHSNLETKARQSTLGTCWEVPEGDEEAKDLSGASTPVIEPETSPSESDLQALSRAASQESHMAVTLRVR